MMHHPPAYAIARIGPVTMGEAIVTYLAAIDATLAPFGGRYLVHGGRNERLEGAWTGDAVILAFPSLDAARAWYASPAYQAILPLRTAHAGADVILVEGVAEGHRATDILGSIGLDGAVADA